MTEDQHQGIHWAFNNHNQHLIAGSNLTLDSSLMVNVQIVLDDERARMPQYATDGALCFDIFAMEDGHVGPGESAIIDTGLRIGLQRGFGLKVHSRSGHGFKFGVRLANCTGIIDSDYRGRIMVKLQNDGGKPMHFKAGDAIAQGEIVQRYAASFEVVQALDTTERGEGGFGSTDKR